MNLYLIGYRGSGKTTVAKVLSQRLEIDAIDTDALVEELAGMSIQEIFAVEGEPAFRSLETKIIHSLDGKPDKVVSLGGGAVLAETNRIRISETGKTVWLRATADVLWARISADPVSESQRPSLSDQQGLAQVRSVLESRVPVYAACADYTIDVDELSPEAVAATITQWWQTVDKD